MAALASHYATELSLALPRGMVCGPGSHWFYASSLTKQKAKRQKRMRIEADLQLQLCARKSLP